MTEALESALSRARLEAQRLNVGYVGTEHLLLALLESQDPSTLRVLGMAGVTDVELRADVERRSERGSVAPAESELPYTPRAQAVLECMLDEVRRMRAHEADTVHLLLALAAEGRGIAAQVLAGRGLGIDELRKLLLPPKPSRFGGLVRWLRGRGAADIEPPA